MAHERLTSTTEEAHRHEAATTSEHCPECNGDIVASPDDSATVCADCGLVIDDQPVDSGPEWRAFTAREQQTRSRVGSPTSSLIHDRGMSTTISWQNKDAQGNWLDSSKRRKLSRLRTWDERFRTQGSDDRNLKHALGEIVRMTSALDLPDTTSETASVIYRRALEEELLPGRSIEGVATAALYAAARLDGIARSIDEVAAVSRVEPKEIKRTYRYVVRELDLAVPPTDPIEYIGRFASGLECADETERLARELVDTATDAGVHSGKHPVGIAASALYAASRLTGAGLTQAEISDVANISEVTIRNRYREVLEATEDDVGAQ